ncbi:hypothetical protein AQUCO_01000411v1 [Aquilegia coerulea]|uniref:Uncharacterized protein n=1 Tax=Aquilegia coerulea TaxID=218851 RepID=A0A2G5E9T8_AQUCA|nr:hypothetical protein AQUCO_01000411v1 [Aquilegia coerulea]
MIKGCNERSKLEFQLRHFNCLIGIVDNSYELHVFAMTHNHAASILSIIRFTSITMELRLQLVLISFDANQNGYLVTMHITC